MRGRRIGGGREWGVLGHLRGEGAGCWGAAGCECAGHMRDCCHFPHLLRPGCSFSSLPAVGRAGLLAAAGCRVGGRREGPNQGQTRVEVLPAAKRMQGKMGHLVRAIRE